MRFWDAALAALLEVTRCGGEAPVRVGADAYDAKAPLRHGRRAHTIHVISLLGRGAASPGMGASGRWRAW